MFIKRNYFDVIGGVMESEQEEDHKEKEGIEGLVVVVGYENGRSRTQRANS